MKEDELTDEELLDFMEAEFHHKISLTRNEALYLDDSCSIMIEVDSDVRPPLTMRGIAPSAGIAVPYEFI